MVDNVLLKCPVLAISGSGSDSELDDEYSSGFENQSSESHTDDVRKN